MTLRFTLGRRLRFAAWFCRSNLFEALAAPVSWAAIVAVALSTAAACIALALPWVTAEIRLHRLQESPWARCVWVYVQNEEFDEKLTDAKVRQIEAAVRNKVRAAGNGKDAAEDGLSVAGFHDVDLRFIELAGTGQIPRRGRTVSPTDPLFPAIPRLLRSGPGFTAPDSPGIILSPALVERLGGSANSPPAEVRIVVPKSSGRDRVCPVVGVLRDPLPLEHDFLLTETEEARFRSIDPENPQTRVRSGPLGPGWPESPSQFPESVRKAARTWGIELWVEDDVSGSVLRLISKGGPLPVQDWREYLVQIRNLMRDAKKSAAPGFDVVYPEQPASTILKPRGPYARATIYVMDLQDLRPAADAVRGPPLDLYANDAARSLVDEIEAAAAHAKVVLISLVAAFCLAGSIALFLALYLRGRQQAAQIGMLRAMGADDRTLRAIVATEAAVLWTVGAAIGLVLALALAWAGRVRYDVTDAELWAAARTGWWEGLIGLYLLASLASCVFGNLWATRRVRRRPAMESLGLTT